MVPFTIACGECFFCQRGYPSGCERSNPDAAKRLSFGVIRRPGCLVTPICLVDIRADRQNICVFRLPMRAPSRCRSLTDEQALFLSDIFSTGYMAADFCDIKDGDTSRLGLRSGWTVRYPLGFPAWRGTGDRDRYRA